MNVPPEMIAKLDRVLTSLEQLLPKPVAEVDWENCPAANWRRHSFSGYLEPIPSVGDTDLDHLLGIDEQKRIVEENTRQFIAGYPANNVLLWGTRGTGKSSLVRAILNRYAEQGLRIIQVDKNDLIYLPDIFAVIKDSRFRFILLCDDLSFDSDDSTYKSLKTVLDGGLEGRPANVIFYATSNRRHLRPAI